MPIKALKVVCIVVLAALLIPVFLILFAISFDAERHFRNIWWLLPWFLGLYGVLGLISTLWSVQYKSAWRLRLEMLLLAMGIAAASLFISALAVIFSGLGSVFGINRGLAMLVLTAAIPTLAIVLAVHGIRHAWRQPQLAQQVMTRRQRAALLLVFLSPLLLCGARLAVQEAAMAWYGHDLPARARAAADQVADGRPYCTFDAHTALVLDDLDARQVLLEAFEKRYGFRQDSKAPHFGMRVAEENYWWSFRQNTFVPLPRIEHVYPLTCEDR